MSESLEGMTEYEMGNRIAGLESALAAEREKVAALSNDLASIRDRLGDAHEQLRCPGCKCADQIDAECNECGCGDPVCARDGSKTLAQAFLDEREKVAALSADLARVTGERDALLGVRITISTPHDVCDGDVTLTIGESIKQYGVESFAWTDDWAAEVKRLREKLIVEADGGAGEHARAEHVTKERDALAAEREKVVELTALNREVDKQFKGINAALAVADVEVPDGENAYGRAISALADRVRGLEGDNEVLRAECKAWREHKGISAVSLLDFPIRKSMQATDARAALTPPAPAGNKGESK